LTLAAIGLGTSEVGVTGTAGGQLVVGPSGGVNAALAANVQVVPLPAAVWMFGAALAGLADAARTADRYRTTCRHSKTQRLKSAMGQLCSFPILRVADQR
jgi:hypothetical protein